MYSNHTLYYLNQIGIRPWIKRNSTLSSPAVTPDVLKLIVFISANLSHKAQVLLKQMLSYVNLSEDELTIIRVDDQEINPKLQQQAKAVWVLGLQPTNNLNFDCPVITGLDPDYLIANPSEKKNVFNDLNHLNQLLA